MRLDPKYALLTIILSVAAEAELHECRGVWTNKQCDTPTGTTVAETQKTQAQMDRKAKYAAADTVLRYVTRSELAGGYYKAYEARKFCRSETVSREACMQRLHETFAFYQPLVKLAKEKQEQRMKALAIAVTEERRHQEKLAELRAIQLEIEELERTIAEDRFYD